MYTLTCICIYRPLVMNLIFTTYIYIYETSPRSAVDVYVVHTYIQYKHNIYIYTCICWYLYTCIYVYMYTHVYCLYPHDDARTAAATVAAKATRPERERCILSGNHHLASGWNVMVPHLFALVFSIQTSRSTSTMNK